VDLHSGSSRQFLADLYFKDQLGDEALGPVMYDQIPTKYATRLTILLLLLLTVLKLNTVVVVQFPIAFR
jgi:hypothetical protein